MDSLNNAYKELIDQVNGFVYLANHSESLNIADSSVEIAFCCNVLDHTESRSKTLKETHRVLKLGGLFCLSVHCRTKEQLSSLHKQAFTYAELTAELLESGFSNLGSRSDRRTADGHIVFDGVFQNGV